MTNPLVSIIIPVFNEERYLEKCLNSLKNQTYKKTEIIIVDDGSTDKSVFITKKFKASLLKQSHIGPGAARNNGAKKASGEILVFVDADMMYDAKYIEMLTLPIRENKVIGTFNKDERVANQINPISACWSINSDLLPGQRTPKNTPNSIKLFRAIRKEKFLKAGGFDGSKGYHDDSTISDKLKTMSVNAPGAISYHFNPETFSEVYFSARWIGRSPYFKPTVVNLLRFSCVNSIRLSFRKVLERKAPLLYIPFKIIYDFGMFSGIFFSFGKVYK